MKYVAAACAAALMLSLAACGQKARPPSAFDGFVSDVTADILQDAPELASQAGLTPEQVGGSFDSRLDDRSPLALELRRGAALRRYAQIRAVDRAALNAPEQETFDVLSAAFAGAAAGARFSYGRFSQIGGFSPYVLNQIDSAFVTLPGFFEHDMRVDSLADGEAYVRRLGQVASALNAEIERARADAHAGVAPPDFVIDRASAIAAVFAGAAPGDLPYVKALRARLEALVGPLPDPPAAGETARQRAARALLKRAETIAADEILPAYKRTQAALAELRVKAVDDPGVWRLPQGDAYYRAELQAETDSDLTPDQIHAIGLARVKQVSGELDMMLRSQGLSEGSVGQRLAQLTADPRFAYAAPADALADVNAHLQRVQAKLRGWFSTLPKARLEVRAAPDYVTDAFTGGYYEAPPLDGAAPGALVINVGPKGGLNRLDLPTLVYHEAIPGHHLQVSRALERADLPLLRRLVTFPEYSEGWAVYAEQLADEMGMYDADPYGRIGYLRWQMWRAARLVVDTGIHAQHWTRAQAAAYLADVTGDSPTVIELEIERYAVEPGQACSYELGREEIARQRDRARSALGERFDIRDFHDAVLAAAELPPAALEARISAWLTSASGVGGVTAAR